MQAFEYCVPTRIVFGKDSVEKLPEQLKKSGASRVLVVYGGHIAKKSGLLDRVFHIRCVPLEYEGKTEYVFHKK